MNHGFIKVATATPHVVIANCDHNEKEILRLTRLAHEQGARLVVFPELSLTAYTCADLFLSQTLLASALTALRSYLSETEALEIVSIVGLPVAHADKLYNCAAVCYKGRLLGLVPKVNLPNYREFNELRYFSPPVGRDTYRFEEYSVPIGENILFACRELPSFVIGVEICEDLAVATSPSAHLCAGGATVIANLSASHELIGKAENRRLLTKARSAQTVCGYLLANSGEGESSTDLVFSGHGMIVENGKILAERAPFSTDELLLTELDVEALRRERRQRNSFATADPDAFCTVSFSLTLQRTALSRTIDPYPFVPAKAEEMAERAELALNMQAHALKQRLACAEVATCVLGISGGLDSTLALLAAVRAIDLAGRPRTDILGITMPCFGTTERTKSNAEALCEALGVRCRRINLFDAVTLHFRDIGHDSEERNVVYENAQARERTQILMDIANAEGGIVVGTGDLSELALGWSTYNGDHMSMYGINSGLPKTLIRRIVFHVAEHSETNDLRKVLLDILNTPVSPELLPAEGGEIAQRTEELVGLYELHDFFLFYTVRHGTAPDKLFRLASLAFDGRHDAKSILHWLRVFYRRFFAQQFKRSCLPDGPKIGTVGLSPRGDWQMPSDACRELWQQQLRELDG